ncbi:MAG: ribose 5-phosphate isomerase B [Bdellovibrionota bacterium]
MNKKSETILIASDHAGVSLKAEIQNRLTQWKWKDLGPLNGNSVDYPDFAKLLAERIASGEASRGILICGSGIGMSIAANKIPGIRAAVVYNTTTARLSREHNDANVLCLGSRFIAPEYGTELAKTWLESIFAGDGRHRRRIRKICELEAKFTNEKSTKKSNEKQ